MIPGRAAAALPASLARILPRLWSCFLIHSLAPPFLGGCGGCGGGVPLPPGIARTIVEIIIPRAVRIDTIVIPCSRNRVFIRSARVLSWCINRCRVSRIRLIWDRRASLVDEAASRRAALSSCSLRRLSAIMFLVASSEASSSLLFSKAMSLSSSKSLARLFVCSPRDLSRALHMPIISRGVYPFLTKTAKSFSAPLAACLPPAPNLQAGLILCSSPPCWTAARLFWFLHSRMVTTFVFYRRDSNPRNPDPLGLHLPHLAWLHSRDCWVSLY